MGQILKQFFAVILCVVFFQLVVACSSYGTEVGNPGQRTVAGNLQTVSSNVAAASLVPQQFASLSSTSCPESNGTVSVGLRNASGEITLQELAADFSFSVSVSQEDRYEVLFLQGGEICGYLTHASDQDQNGLRVTLGKGSQTVSLGEVTDLGGGVFISQNNPAGFCDDDGDGFTDDIDDDDDGDGRRDRDGDFDGYLDWFDNDDDGDGVLDEDDDEESEGSCQVVYVFPSETSGLPVDSSGMGQVEVYMSDDVLSVNGSLLSVLDSDGATVIDGFAESAIEILEDLVVVDLDLDDGDEYVLMIDAGAVVCGDGTLEDEVEIEFFVVG